MGTRSRQEIENQLKAAQGMALFAGALESAMVGMQNAANLLAEAGDVYGYYVARVQAVESILRHGVDDQLEPGAVASLWERVARAELRTRELIEREDAWRVKAEAGALVCGDCGAALRYRELNDDAWCPQCTDVKDMVPT